jgi:hypothetical protein
MVETTVERESCLKDTRRVKRSLEPSEKYKFTKILSLMS